MPTGTVKKFFTERGFGFIAPDNGGDDVFVHVSAIGGTGSEELVEGQHVEFEVEQGPKGPQAKSVRSA
jgi:CspA family cold shock protein